MELIKKVLVICLFLLNILPWTQNSAVAQNPGTEYEPTDHGSYIVWTMDDNGEYLPDYGHPVYEVPPGGIIITDNDNSNTDPNLQNNEDSPYEDDDTDGIPNWMDDYWDIDHDGINNIDDPDFDNDQDGIPNRDDPQWPPNQANPCEKAMAAATKATTLSQNNSFASALNNIQTAFASDGKEHGTAIGRDASGNITASPISNTGTQTSGTIPSWPNTIADLHNHPDNSPPSSGDIYGFMDLITPNSAYETRYIVTLDGNVYALVALDPQGIANFNTEHPRVPPPPGTNFEPTFPQGIVDEINEIIQLGGASSEIATAFILDKYNAGVALLKQDNDGNFIRFVTTENVDANGNKTYTANNCP